MNRRSFLQGAASAAAAIACPHASLAQAASARLTLRSDPSAPHVPLNYTGLSYELAQLTDPTFFSASNRNLVACFRLLTPHGVLRIGGNTSEFCWFKASADTPEPKLHVPTGNLDANWMPHRLFAITPQAIDALAGFLQATGWRLIYGLNFGNSTPQRAAEEAAYVAAKIGSKLEFFQIGNEPDLYHTATNGTRPPDWGFEDYLHEWTAFAQTISARVPSARFGGPDVAAASHWVTQFGQQVPAEIAPRLVALTGHYYAEGPPNDPRVTTERLLRGNASIPSETSAIEAVARAHNRIYRMTEGNSCYRGGKPGMSNAFAAALWAGDYMLQLASLGCAGVNLHGGRSAFLTAGLGDHTPGMEVAKTPQAMRSGFYTPIFTEPDMQVVAMPIFYGMMLANQFAGSTILNVTGDLKPVNATAYAAKREHEIILAIFNKDASMPLDVSIRAPRAIHTATAWRLQAPALDSTSGVMLAGSEIQPHAQWSPKAAEPIAVSNGIPRIHVPAASAALLFLR